MIEVEVNLERDTAVEPSPNVVRVASMFGLGIDRAKRVCVVPRTRVCFRPGQVVFITGPSGGGKSTLLALLHDALQGNPHATTTDFDHLPTTPDLPLIDALSNAAPAQPTFNQVMRTLSIAGLNDAFVMLRTPSQLSDGQRYRFQLAQTLLTIPTKPAPHLNVVFADEFASTLDRITARVIAMNLRKWASRRDDVCFVAATSHDDLLEALHPDILIEKGLGAEIQIAARDPQTTA